MSETKIIKEEKIEGRLFFAGTIKFEQDCRVEGDIDTGGAGDIEANQSLSSGGDIVARNIKTEKDLTADGNIIALEHIKAGGSIRAGEAIETHQQKDGEEQQIYIEAGGDIQAGFHVGTDGYLRAGWNIEAKDSVEAGESIEAGGDIKAAHMRIFVCRGDIKALGSIETLQYIAAPRGSIEAGADIQATEGGIIAWNHIKAGRDIKAGKSINAHQLIEVGDEGRIFAGLSARKSEKEEQKIQAEEIKGEIGSGIKVVLGVKSETPQETSVTP